MIAQLLNLFESQTLADRLLAASIELLALAAVVAVAVRLFRLRAPRVQALLWTLVLAKPVLSLIVGTPMPAIEVERPAAVVLAAEDSSIDAMIAARMAEEARNFRPIRLPEEAAPQGTAAASIGVSTRVIQTPVEASRSYGMATMLLLLWAVGVVASFLMLCIDMFRAHRLRRFAHPAGERILQLAGEESRAMGLSTAAPVLVSDRLESPALVGILSPVVYIPEWIAQEGNESRLRWLLRHELMHRAQRDPAALAVRRLAQILFFFHPAVWIAGRRWEEAMELATDRALVNSEDDARSYAQELYAVLEMQHHRQRAFSGQGLFATRTQIGKRIAALLTEPLSTPARAGTLPLTLLGLFALGVATTGIGFATQAAEEKTEEKEEPETLEDAQIRSRVSRARADLRSMHTAIESYKVDFNTYPRRMEQLTTPISYMTGFFMDPFTGEKEEEQAPYRMTYSPDRQNIYIYSVGPDGVDQSGVPFYDPANGTRSEGDIVRSIELKGIDLYEDRELGLKVNRQRELLRAYRDKILATLTELDSSGNVVFMRQTEKALGPLPEDIFMPGSPVKLMTVSDAVTIQSGEPDRVSMVNGKIHLYSVGPDGVDGEAKNPIEGFVPAGEIPQGDIVEKIDLTEVANNIRQTQAMFDTPYDSDSLPDVLKEDLYYQELVKLRERTSRDNAMIHYVMAGKLAPELAIGEPYDSIIADVLKNGWSASAEGVIPYLTRWEPVFRKVKQGVAVDYAEGIGNTSGPATPVPNFLAAQTTGKLLLVSGWRHAGAGNHDAALDDMLAALIMGRDYGADGNLLIGGFISVAIQNMSARNIGMLVKTGELSPSQLERIVAQVSDIRRSKPPITLAFEVEHAMNDSIREKMLATLGDLTPEQLEEFARRTGRPASVESIRAMILEDKVATESFREVTRSYLQMEPWQRDHAAFTDAIAATKIESNHLFNSIPNYIEATTRETVMMARRALTETAAILELHKLSNGRYPDSLSEIAGRSLPLDPFTGENLRYESVEGGSDFVLYSLGPDRIDNPGVIEYSPAGGTLSEGDIYY